MYFDKEEVEGRKRQLAALRKLGDDDLLIAYAYGFKDPNVDSGDTLTKAVLDTRISMRMEKLTVQVFRLTVGLFILTFIAVVEPIAIEWWHANHEKPPIVIVQPPPQTADAPAR